MNVFKSVYSFCRSQVSEAFVPNEINWNWKGDVPGKQKFFSMVGGVDDVSQGELYDILGLIKLPS